MPGLLKSLFRPRKTPEEIIEEAWVSRAKVLNILKHGLSIFTGVLMTGEEEEAPLWAGLNVGSTAQQDSFYHTFAQALSICLCKEFAPQYPNESSSKISTKGVETFLERAAQKWKGYSNLLWTLNRAFQECGILFLKAKRLDSFCKVAHIVQEKFQIVPEARDGLIQGFRLFLKANPQAVQHIGDYLTQAHLTGRYGDLSDYIHVMITRGYTLQLTSDQSPSPSAVGT